VLEVSAGLMPTEARGSYLPEAPLLMRDKDLSKLYACERVDSGTGSHSSRHDMLAIISSDINTAHFYLLLQKLCQIT